MSQCRKKQQVELIMDSVMTKTTSNHVSDLPGVRVSAIRSCNESSAMLVTQQSAVVTGSFTVESFSRFFPRAAPQCASTLRMLCSTTNRAPLDQTLIRPTWPIPQTVSFSLLDYSHSVMRKRMSIQDWRCHIR